MNIEQEINETQQNFYEYLPKLSNGATEISNLFRTEKLADAFSLIEQFVDGAEWILEVIRVMYNHGYSFETKVEKLTEFLGEIRDGLTRRDYVLVADLFEYEIEPLLTELCQQQFVPVQ